MSGTNGSTRVTFLGAGDAFAAGGHFHAAYLAEGDDATVMLDCGATSLTAIKRLGLDLGRLDAIVISHLHGDHFAGLPFLFIEFKYLQARTRPLRIAGPPGTPERVRQLFGAMYRELAGEALPFPLEFVELRPGVPAEVGKVRIEPFRVPHQERDISLGVRVGIGSANILYSGDTGWTEDLIRYAEGTDLFICECCFFETRTPTHLDYPRIAEQRRRFGTRRLVLTHLGDEVLARRGEITEELATEGLVVQV
ncbi:MBL fold metallo-hydrolase [Candidatus Binatia bacterium]|nr:MBL fold metallo-hydrolase [Candidatus Binatia bacterium]